MQLRQTANENLQSSANFSRRRMFHASYPLIECRLFSLLWDLKFRLLLGPRSTNTSTTNCSVKNCLDGKSGKLMLRESDRILTLGWFSLTLPTGAKGLPGSWLINGCCFWSVNDTCVYSGVGNVHEGCTIKAARNSLTSVVKLCVDCSLKDSLFGSCRVECAQELSINTVLEKFC